MATANQTKTYHDFDAFYQQTFIKSIADNPKWTVSDINKVPIDMFSFEYKHKLHGALYSNELSLVTLPHLCRVLPNATNNAYYLDALVDKFVVLDIEPKCPAKIKKKLLQLPYIYGEKSMSGNGYHLIFMLPDCLSKYPIAQNKRVMKEEHGYYEILLNHWVTFTRNQIPDATGELSFDSFFEEIASEQKESIRNEIDIDKFKPDTIHRYDQIMRIMLNQNYHKKPCDFYDDMSKFEYATIGFFYWKLKTILDIIAKHDEYVYTDSEKAWLLYITAQEKIQHRDKHDESRNGLPWLLYLTQEIMAKN